MLTENDYLKNILKAPVYDVARVTDFQKLKKISSKTKNLVFIKNAENIINYHSIFLSPFVINYIKKVRGDPK